MQRLRAINNLKNLANAKPEKLESCLIKKNFAYKDKDKIKFHSATNPQLAKSKVEEGTNTSNNVLNSSLVNDPRMTSPKVRHTRRVLRGHGKQSTYWKASTGDGSAEVRTKGVRRKHADGLGEVDMFDVKRFKEDSLVDDITEGDTHKYPL